MANQPVEYAIEITDINGDRALMRVGGGADPAAVTIADLIATATSLSTALGAPGSLTNGKVTRRSVHILIDRAQTTPGSGTPPLDAWFSSVSDKAQLLFGNALGDNARLSIPAPVEALFHAPPADLNVNPAYAALSAFITAVEGVMSDRGGNNLNLYLGGTYVGHRRHRRQGRM